MFTFLHLTYISAPTIVHGPNSFLYLPSHEVRYLATKLRGATIAYFVILHLPKWGGRLQLKIYVISENVLNKSCWALNFLKKSQWVHMSISPRREAGGGGSKDCHFRNTKMYKKRQSRFISGLNTAKNTYFIKNFFK